MLSFSLTSMLVTPAIGQQPIAIGDTKISVLPSRRRGSVIEANAYSRKARYAATHHGAIYNVLDSSAGAQFHHAQDGENRRHPGKASRDRGKSSTVLNRRKGTRCC